MSLETALAENTAAINNLIAALGQTPVGATAPAPKKEKATPAKKAEAAPEVVALDYEKDVKPQLIPIVGKHGKDFLVGVLQEKFGIDHASKLKPHQLQDALDAVLAAAAAKEAEDDAL